MGLVATRLLRQVKPNIRVGWTEPFIAADHYREDLSESARIKIEFLSATFRSCLLPLREPDTSVCDLAPYTVEFPADHKQLFSEIENLRPVLLSQVYQLLEHQPHGEPGPLLTNHAQNIFPVQCIHGQIVPVCISYWHVPGGWQIFSVRHNHTERQFAGYQVIAPV